MELVNNNGYKNNDLYNKNCNRTKIFFLCQINPQEFLENYHKQKNLCLTK